MTNVAEIRRGFAAADLLAAASGLARATIAEECAAQCLENESVLLCIRESLFDGYLVRGELCARRGLQPSTSDGWTWPVRVIESGYALGRIGGKRTKHYFPSEILPSLARAIEGACFRRRHPMPGDANFELAAGWISGARIEGSAIYANVVLFKREHALRAALSMAREDGRLDLFGLSIEGSFRFQQRIRDGMPSTPIATSLDKLDGVDLVCEGGAGGRFLG